ncbi:ATP-dependent DNA ligase (plasmid) [Streptomyces cynarae]|uniref:ATP-dependent DNA ligase n=1 Tax=Streptomyces cynarae TaxID=2981134 RepID=A0ABY6EEG4_9ACTN|nr:ATP-dependent DNA ligase [Streptomyces cynarae]UXY25044.1 ATP-dependent DNA ligase [Streptomyces cynarae]
MAWDVLLRPEHGDVRARPYDDPLALLVDLVQEYDVQPPLQLVPLTDDPTVAMTWHQQLPEQGIEGIVAKPATSDYKSGRIWKKIRHAETVEADVVGYAGPAARPRALAVRLPAGRIALSQSLKAPLAAQIAVHFAASGPSRTARTRAGEAYAKTAPGLVVEVLAGTTRHAVVTVTRLRSPFQYAGLCGAGHHGADRGLVMAGKGAIAKAA